MAVHDNLSTMYSPQFTRTPIPAKGDSFACWIVTVNDGFNTQIGTRLEKLHDGKWRFVLKGTTINFDSEQQALLFIAGVLVGRCLC
jgi:hypothetical protein